MNEILITAAQCRAARALIDWSREALADKSSVALRTIVDFERGARAPRKVTLTALERALNGAGIEFINDERGDGVVKLRGELGAIHEDE